MNNDRSVVIENLLNLSSPLDDLRQQLSSFDWDFEGVAVVLNRHHVMDVLSRYLSGELTAAIVEQWANLLEGREDISFDRMHEKWIADTIFELANPVLTARLDMTRARELIAQATAVGAVIRTRADL